MNWKPAYLIASSTFQAVMYIGAAYFHNAWSWGLVALGLMSGISLGVRCDRWEKEQ